MYATLNCIRDAGPCIGGWERLLRNLDKFGGDDQPLGMEAIYASNGLEDALWCIRAFNDADRKRMQFSVWCAEQTKQWLPEDAHNLLETAHLAADAGYSEALKQLSRKVYGILSAKRHHGMPYMSYLALTKLYFTLGDDSLDQARWASYDTIRLTIRDAQGKHARKLLEVEQAKHARKLLEMFA